MYLNDIELNIIKERSGWKAKIGVIYIASSLSLEREWHMALPEDCLLYTSRCV